MFQRIADRLKALAGQRSTTGQIAKANLVSLLPPDPVIVEAGAHTGVDTIEMARLWPKGSIHAFEPLPELFRLLEKRTLSQPNVKVYPMALGAHNGTARFHVSGGASDASSSLLPPKDHLVDHADVTFQRQVEVPVMTLDSWAAKHKVDHVDFLWLDMQGFELNMLKAAPRLLSTVQVIHAEVFLKESYSNVPLYPEVRNWLAEQGFRVEHEELPWADAGNVLFVR